MDMQGERLKVERAHRVGPPAASTGRQGPCAVLSNNVPVVQSSEEFPHSLRAVGYLSSVIDSSDLEDPVTVDPGSSTLFFTSQVTCRTMEDNFAEFSEYMFDTYYENNYMEDAMEVPAPSRPSSRPTPPPFQPAVLRTNHVQSRWMSLSKEQQARNSVIDPSNLEDPVTVDPGSSTLFFTSQNTCRTMEDNVAEFSEYMFDTYNENNCVEDALEDLFHLMEDIGTPSENVVSDTTWASHHKSHEMLIQDTPGVVSLPDNRDEKVESPKAPVMSLAEVSFSDVSLFDNIDEKVESPKAPVMSLAEVSFSDVSLSDNRDEKVESPKAPVMSLAEVSFSDVSLFDYIDEKVESPKAPVMSLAEVSFSDFSLFDNIDEKVESPKAPVMSLAGVFVSDVSLSDNRDEKVESPKAPVMSLAEVSFSDISLSDDNDENPPVPAPQTPPPPSRPSSRPTPPPFQPAVLCTNHVQSRFHPYQRPVDNLQRAAANALPAIPPPLSNNVPAVQSSKEFPHSLRHVGYVNGEAVFELPQPYVPNISAAVPIQHQQEKRYVKKPPNAFMLYRQEQRHNVVLEYNITDSAVVNKILGAKWKSLSKEQQARYYERAAMEKLFHAQQHPEWSAKDNYGKNRKRKDNNQAETEPAAVSKRAKESCGPFSGPYMTQPHMTQPYMTQPYVMQPHMNQAYMTQPHMNQAYMTQPHMNQAYMSQPHMSQPQMTQPYMTQLHMNQAYMTQPHMTQPHMKQAHMSQPHMSQPHMTPPHATQPHMTQQDIDAEIMDILQEEDIQLI
ncbi:hypothetical protein PAMA_017002 [Pampus argenteus]